MNTRPLFLNSLLVLCVALAGCNSNEDIEQDDANEAAQNESQSTQAAKQPGKNSSGKDAETTKTSSTKAEGKNAAADAAIGSLLTGNWFLQLRNGTERPVTVESIGENRYRFEFPGNFGGEYELVESELKMVKPRRKKMASLVWKVEKPNSLVVVKAPSKKDVGADYTGMKLQHESLKANEQKN